MQIYEISYAWKKVNPLQLLKSNPKLCIAGR